MAGYLLPRLPEDDRKRITEGLLRVARDPDLPLRTRLLGMLGGCLDQENLDYAVDTVLAVEGNEKNTCAALRGLLPYVSHAMLRRIYQLVADRNPLVLAGVSCTGHLRCTWLPNVPTWIGWPNTSRRNCLR